MSPMVDMRIHGRNLPVDLDELSPVPFSDGDSTGLVRIDNSPTIAVSNAIWVTGWAACWVDCFVKSTLTPTNLRLVAEYVGDQGDGADWYQVLEGFWSTVFWEDADTASGIRESLKLPLGGRQAIRFRLVGTGTDATNFFEVRLKLRFLRPDVASPHA